MVGAVLSVIAVRRTASLPPAYDPAIHVFASAKKGRRHRDKPADDDGGVALREGEVKSPQKAGFSLSRKGLTATPRSKL